MRLFSLVALALLIATALTPASAKDATFVTPEQSKAFQILPQPPANDSEITKAELAELHAIEAKRTPAEAEQAKWDDLNENVFLFKTVFGDDFTPEKLPVLAAFAKQVRGDEGINTAPAKDGFRRPRPYNLDKTLHPICKLTDKDNSYPSGHTTSGYLLALMLIDMVPERRDAILERADSYGHDRLVCGVHYPSDLAASRLIAYTMHAFMVQNPAYAKDITPARAELRQALGLAPAN